MLIVTGSVASAHFAPDHPPVDALIVGILDNNQEEHS